VKRVLVTGASGFIGRHTLAPLRERGFEVHAVTATHPPAESGARWHRADLHDRDALDSLVGDVGATHLLHLAWHVPPGDYLASPENLRWTRTSIAILEAFARAGGERFVGVGTCFEYELGAPPPFSEAETPLVPHTLYGTSKDALRRVVGAAAPVLGLSAAWARIFYLYGPHEPPGRLVPTVIAGLLEGTTVDCAGGEQRRDYMCVGDVGDALSALVDCSVQGAVNVAWREAVEVRAILCRLGELAGRPELLHMGARPTSPGEPQIIEADVRRLHDEVGWCPHVALDEGLAATMGWWKGTIPQV